MGAYFFALLVSVSGCRGDAAPTSTALSADDAREVLIDRNWLDRWPSSKDDRLHVYRFTPSMGGGVYQDRTLFRGTFELFRFATSGDRLVIDFPDDGVKVDTAYRIEPVGGPEPFDLRLTLGDSPRGPRVFYGISAEGSAQGGDRLMPFALEQ
jgi:hypothetical protein